jgi:predicted oxidoreductase
MLSSLTELEVHDSLQYSMNFKAADPSVTHKINYHGNSAKSMHLSVEASLKKLRTSYIDILYVHVWDFETSIEEVMNNLHNLVVSGKVLYLVKLFLLLVVFYSDFFLLRASPILLLGSFLKQTNTLAITARHHSAFTKDAGMSWTELSSVRLSPWPENTAWLWRLLTS